MKFRQPKRRVHAVFLHCSASDNEALKGDALVAEITKWHQARKFSTIGYHYVIDKDGRVLDGRSLEATPAAQAGYNTGTIAICVHGLAKEKFTDAALSSLVNLCDAINQAYRGNIVFRGHKEVAAKACPVFEWRKVLQLDGGGKMPLEMKRNDR